MIKPTIEYASRYVGLEALAFGELGKAASPVTRAQPLPVTDPARREETIFRSAVAGFSPTAQATDFAALAPQFFGRSAFVRRVTISGTADSPAVLDILAQRSLSGGGGTFSTSPVGSESIADNYSAHRLYTYSTNRTSRGQGVSSERALLASGKLHLGTATVKSSALILDFHSRSGGGIALHDIEEWFVLNLNGQNIPAGCSLDVTVEWAESTVPSLFFVGDSTTSNAVHMFNRLVTERKLHNGARLANYGSNGYRLLDYLLGTGGIPWPVKQVNSRLSGRSGVLVLCYGLNDMRQGALSEAQLISMIDATIHATLNGTVQGQSYRSALGAGTTFDWPTNADPAPDTKILLWGPNSLTSDGNASAAITLTGQWSGMTLPAAAQAMTDQIYRAYAAFENDPRIYAVVQKQDVFGRKVQSLDSNGLMTDILHPAKRGQQLSADQITVPVRGALAALTA